MENTWYQFSPYIELWDGRIVLIDTVKYILSSWVQIYKGPFKWIILLFYFYPTGDGVENFINIANHVENGYKIYL